MPVIIDARSRCLSLAESTNRATRTTEACCGRYDAGIFRSVRATTARASWPRALYAKDDAEEEGNEPGMADAFRQLDALASLDDEDKETKQALAAKKIAKPADLGEATGTAKEADDIPPEKEMKLYKDMVVDLETKKEDDLYEDMITDMGGSTDSISRSAPDLKSGQRKLTVEESTESKIPDAEQDTEEFMNQALREALEDVRVQNPSISQSVLDDREIMKEIEAIFERGNEKLLDSLEEIRKEQVRYYDI